MNYGRMPDSIAAVIGKAAGYTDSLGMSDAKVIIYEDYVLKVRPAGGRDTADIEALHWLAGRLPVPEVIAHEVVDREDWLLMSRLKGKMLCDHDVMSRPALLLDCMAEALHLLWSVDVTDCPLVKTLGDELEDAERNIRAGTIKFSCCEPETFGPAGFANADELLNWLRLNMPASECTLTHGDFCLPNLFTDGKRFTGMIDLGDCGIADPWRDISLGWRSLKHNSDGHFGSVYSEIDPDDLFRAIGIPKDEEKLRYYLLLDELF